jgi:hypothetical protein
MDELRKATGQKLLDAAQGFWEACQLEKQYGAIQWLEGTNGELIIYTRFEYRDALLDNIERLTRKGDVHRFAEQMPANEVDDG